MKRWLTLVMLAVLLRGTATGYTTSGLTVQTDGTESDFTNGFNFAQSQGVDGWTVRIGTGGSTYYWNSPGTWVQCAPSNTMTICGGDPVNLTTVFWKGADAYMFVLACLTNKLLTFKDLSLNWTNLQPGNAIVGVFGEGCTFRLSNLHFTNTSASKWFVSVGGANNTDPTLGPYGLIDHCTFRPQSADNWNCINIQCNDNLNHGGWLQPMSWGTTNVVCVEDCLFTQPDSSVNANASVEASAGARFVYRHNVSTNMAISVHGLQSGAHDGTLQAEVYTNVFDFNDGGHETTYVGYWRGGSLRLWNNVVNNHGLGTIGAFWYFLEECASASWNSESCARQLLYPADYPGFQQIGWGASISVTTQTNWPCYVWGNSYGSLPTYLGLDADAAFIVQGRDIFTNTPAPGDTPLVYPHPFISGAQPQPAGVWMALPIQRKNW